MKKVSIVFTVLFLVGVLVASCNKRLKSAKTGWNLNDKNYGFEVAKKS